MYSFIASRELAIGLFSAVCIFAIFGTISGKESIYSSPIFRTIIGLIGLNLLFCTLQRVKILPRSIFIMHIGIILTLMGGVVSTFGYVATVNIYEGTSVDKAYRWDIEKDIPLGMELALEKINMEYYPIPVKIGVLKGKEKVGLYILKTGESFNLEDYEVKVDALELSSESLKLSVFNQGHFIGTADTSGVSNLPPDFPYAFVLVAFKDPALKRMWVDLRFSKGSEIIAEGTSEVNSPFVWKGLRFHHVQIARDPYGMPYAGIQITNDPGRPYVFFGFSIIGIGSLLYFVGRVYGSK
ncbi:MAG: ResB-like family cytochrome C biogenesis protein [Nitrospirae bacterium RBG_13_39_12]|nr:MAG: ResB-like family cytochrome C biogenesis protein [Nitrospirae bacterium RBG_13_39_12]